jgi:cytochrome c
MLFSACNTTSDVVTPVDNSDTSTHFSQNTTGLPFENHEGMPDQTKFVRDILDVNLYEPIELVELPNQGVLFIERKGEIKLYDFSTNKVDVIAHKEVFSENEDGLIGIAVDPNYLNNNWIYLFYSVPGDESIQHISRFDLVNKQLDLTSEKVLLTIPVIRECCHSGGSLKFGPDGYLYVGVGDNTNPFKSDGFAPIDERAGKVLYDAQKSAANSNDLRGKILRIKPEDNGTYSIPAGNLFPEGTAKTRPEIYIMGLRNPYRYSFDSENNYLYWGDVGPDAGKDDANRGPKGLGEINLAKSAGNWGWPYTRGNNQLYNDYDFDTEKSGEKFDPNNLINNSPNNTGLTNLPPAQESMIWYSYDESKEFPWLGKGGVNPMAGPLFHKNDFDKSVNTFPTYFEDKLFVYEWMRDWIYVVELDDDKNYVSAQPFLPSEKFSKPIDMLFASDGNLYVLEYGAKWFKRNKDARLNRISYVSGNRKPIAKITVDKISGAAPLPVVISGKDSIDYDKDTLTYQWRINGDLIDSTSADIQTTFEKNGAYIVELTVSDEAGLQAKESLTILVGNSEPEITISISPTTKTYTHNSKVSYEVLVTDVQDGSSTDNSILPDDIKISLNYVAAHEFTDKSEIGHQKNTSVIGKQLIDGTDCRACHGVSEKVNGPSYQSIASKYSVKDIDYLVKRVIDGGAGVWGESPMSAHPQLSVKDVTSIVEYILSLDPNSDQNKGLPLKGELFFNKHPANEGGGKYILQATYQDKGINNNDSTRLTVTEQLIFTANK